MGVGGTPRGDLPGPFSSSQWGVPLLWWVLIGLVTKQVLTFFQDLFSNQLFHT